MLKFKATSNGIDCKLFIAQISPGRFALFGCEDIVANRFIDTEGFSFLYHSKDKETIRDNIVNFCKNYNVTFTEKQLEKLEAKLEKIYA